MGLDDGVEPAVCCRFDWEFHGHRRIRRVLSNRFNSGRVERRDSLVTVDLTLLPLGESIESVQQVEIGGVDVATGSAEMAIREGWMGAGAATFTSSVKDLVAGDTYDQAGVRDAASDTLCICRDLWRTGRRGLYCVLGEGFIVVIRGVFFRREHATEALTARVGLDDGAHQRCRRRGRHRALTYCQPLVWR